MKMIFGISAALVCLTASSSFAGSLDPLQAAAGIFAPADSADPACRYLNEILVSITGADATVRTKGSYSTGGYFDISETYPDVNTKKYREITYINGVIERKYVVFISDSLKVLTKTSFVLEPLPWALIPIRRTELVLRVVDQNHIAVGLEKSLCVLSKTSSIQRR